MSHTETLSDLLEVLVLQQETGLIVPNSNEPEHQGLMVVPLFETIPDLGVARKSCRNGWTCLKSASVCVTPKTAYRK